MNINTKNLVSITEANQNFSKIARMVDKDGSVVILKNNTPKYVIIDFNTADEEKFADNETLSEISRRIIEKNKETYKLLAK